MRRFEGNYKFSSLIQKERKEYRKTKKVKKSPGFNYEEIESWNITWFYYNQTKTKIIIKVQKEILCVKSLKHSGGNNHTKDDIFEMASRSLDSFLGILSA